MPGDVAGVQLGLDGIGDGREDHGNVLILGGGVAGHGGVGGDAHHQIHILGGKALGDLGGDGVVKTDVLIVDLKVHALHQTGLLQPLEEADAAVVQGGVFAVLGNAR